MSDEYGDMVWKSEQHDKTVASLFEAGKDPRQTPSDSVVAVVNGYRSQATDMRNKLKYAEAEIKNREEQVGRLKQQVTDEQNLRKAETSALLESQKAVAKLRGEYEGRIESLQTQVNQANKHKGEVLRALAVMEAENKELKEGSTKPLTLYDVLKLIFPKIIKWLRSIKL